MENTKKLLRIATAGSVDDGKSTLIGRLLLETGGVYQDQLAAVERAGKKKGLDFTDLSLITDGLAAEREQNITIDVAYRYLNLGDKRIIVADVPGHEQYTKNMATGASLADLALVLIDVKNKLTKQTETHLTFLSGLNIHKILIVVNKMDTVDYKKGYFEEVKKVCRERMSHLAASGLALPQLDFIPISALAGDMVTERGDNMPWHTGPTILEYLLNAQPQNLQSMPVRLPVQTVLRGENGQRRYAGLLESGVIETGQEILSLPSGMRAIITDIYLGYEKISRAVAGESIAITLDKQLDISRGDLFAHPKYPPVVSNEFLARIFWFRTDSTNRDHPYLIKHLHKFARVQPKAFKPIPQNASFEHPEAPGMIFQTKLVSQIPLIYDNYTSNRATGSFIIVDEITKDTIAAGMIE